MMLRKVKIGVMDNRTAAREFIDAWDRAEKGKPPEEPIERLYFQDMETLLKTMTPVRWTLLKLLHSTGPSSIRKLSKTAGRDYSSVHRDVQILGNSGLILKDESGLVSAPWHSIVSEVILGDRGEAGTVSV